MPYRIRAARGSGASAIVPRPVPLPDDLLGCIEAALVRREPLLQRLREQGTDCVRLFHGIAEGEPGLSIDRYGPLLLLQTNREPLSHDDTEEIGRFVQERLGTGLHVVGNHRLGPGKFGAHMPTEAALQEHVCREGGLAHCIQARHRGMDPWLFLDLRKGREVVRQLAKEKRTLNLFSYTCGIGVAALAGGALSVTNVDFAASALEVGRRNAEHNGLLDARFVTLQSDCIPVLRQLAGKPVQRRGRALRFAKIEPQPFDLVVLDPPRWAKGPFGAVDVVRDYAALFKPCVLTASPGGTILATNHVPQVTREDFAEQLRRCASKAGRPLRSLELLCPDEDFPAFDQRPPLKIALCSV